MRYQKKFRSYFVFTKYFKNFSKKRKMQKTSKFKTK